MHPRHPNAGPSKLTDNSRGPDTGHSKHEFSPDFQRAIRCSLQVDIAFPPPSSPTPSLTRLFQEC